MSEEFDALGPDRADKVSNITAAIARQAGRHPAAPALILSDRVISYREMMAAIHANAWELLNQGVRPGQVLGVSMLQTPHHLVTLLAIALIGAVSVPVHAALPAERRYLAARRFAVSAIVSGRSDQQLEGIPFILLKPIDLTAAVPPLPPSTTQPGDLCRLVLSSGTSGDPKGVMCTHGYFLDRVDKSPYACTPQSRLLATDFNYGGFGHAMRMLIGGGAIVLPPANEPASQAYMVRSHSVTHWLLSPSMAEDILPLLEDDDVHFPSLVYLQILGAAPGKRLLDALFARFTPHVYVTYSTSEVGPVALTTPELLRQIPESAGRPCAWVNLEIVDDNDRPVPAGQVGRLRMKWDGMFTEYYRDPALTAERFRDGWFYPRDSARLDEQGLLYIEGREDDVVNIDGKKVYLREIEAVMQSHPAIREVAAFLVSSPGKRSLLAAAILAADPAPPIEVLQAWAQAKLGSLCPDKLFYVDDFPRTTTRKILRNRIVLPRT
ncbi:class I adenylate-forming enzyme family protein [Paraburkholderia acidipaludis]|uniref:class I adenylate-forming enzyme family protein n=1 Tax=Paraburkholderia acidipaludis TaxID=660537 RepID=UPI000486FAD7|nr:class I adenylate-forming enzyme family protein [Paraburkholderia acidipaludis]